MTTTFGFLGLRAMAMAMTKTMTAAAARMRVTHWMSIGPVIGLV